MVQQAKAVLLRNSRAISFVLAGGIAVALIILITLSGGCATLDTITGKADLEKGKANLKQQLATLKAELSKLENIKTDIEKQLVTERISFEKKEAEYKEQIENLEISKTKGISILFFGGDIVYEIAPEAFRDYRAGLRYKALIEPDFASEFQKFEEGHGGDASVLKVLKEIDTSGDRFIDSDEALLFRKTEEDKYL